MTLFPGFERRRFVLDGIGIHAAVGPPSGAPPLLLLHGYPQTHAIWHATVPRLAARFDVVAADLRGYGDSSKPAPSTDHAPYSKRKVRAPLLALWGAHGVVEKCFRTMDEWRRVADDVRGRALPAGHYLPEEVPDLVADELEAFFR